jgi:hypothetical protein
VNDINLALEPLVYPVGHVIHSVAALDNGRINGVEQKDSHHHADNDEKGGNDCLIHFTVPV